MSLPFTTETHPFQIYAIPVGYKGGMIGLSQCPWISNNQSENWRHEVARDIATLHSWAACDVLSLIELPEFIQLGVLPLPDVLDAIGISWHHLPMAERKAPCKRFENVWKQTGKHFQTLLLEGGRLLIHGGSELGRAETIAAKILIETCMAPQAAIDKIRAIRGAQAIEAPEQLRYLLQVSN